MTVENQKPIFLYAILNKTSSIPIRFPLLSHQPVPSQNPIPPKPVSNKIAVLLYYLIQIPIPQPE